MAKTKTGLKRAEERRSSGPTRKELDYDTLYDLASHGHTITTIADYCGVGIETINQNQDYLDCVREGRAFFTDTILRKQLEIALDNTHRGQVPMLTHIGKTQLKQVEKVESKIEVNSSDIFLKLLETK